MSVEQNKAIAQRAIENFNQGNLDGYLELYDAHAIVHGYPGVEPGIESIRQFYAGFLSAFPDTQVMFEDVVSEGDQLVIRYTTTGTNKGEFMGMPATGKRVKVAGITILRFVEGKCVERWSQLDFLGLMQQLGIVPPPGEADR